MIIYDIDERIGQSEHHVSVNDVALHFYRDGFVNEIGHSSDFRIEPKDDTFE